MGLRRVYFLLSVTCVLTVAACGDNKEFVFHDAGIDGSGSGSGVHDAGIDAPPDALTCDSPKIICNNACIDPRTDNSHCGDCATACTNGATCQTDGSSTMCCPPGQTNCGGTCVDMSSDEAHCGACTTACGNNETCDNGTCCGPGTTTCSTPTGNACFNTQTDEMHCGNCTTQCGANETCEQGICCATGQVNCNGQCVDTNTDEAYCGGCPGTTCTNGQSCEAGICCTTGELNCSNSCVDPKTDEAHCGNCNTVCTNTQTCTTRSDNTDPKCCTTGFNNCGGTCSNPLTDNLNCGACGNACGAGESCSDGKCCGPGQTNCNGTCVDLVNDNMHCGSCSNVCSGATPVCSGNTCSAVCGAGETNCSGDCVVLGSDHENCGACGTACAANEVCNNGNCATMCGVGLMVCNGQCVDKQTDANNCGSCGNVCGPTDDCVAGQCVLRCNPGTVLCGGQCIDTSNDEANCGGCVANGTGTACVGGATCDDGICCAAPKVNVNGICCLPGQLNCGNTCVDPTTDEAHCGNCTTACGANETCNAATPASDSKCCPNGQILCNGACVDPATDPNNCGGCAATTGDTCTPGAETCQAGICCGTGTNACGNGCFDFQTDEAHCGNCQTACAVGESCVNGACEVNCPFPTNMCGPGGINLCTDLDTDEQHCGNCTTVCVSGTTCNAGVCSSCGTGLTACPAPTNACVDLDTNTSNCGACNNKCAAGETCTDGTCCSAGEVACTPGNPASCSDLTNDPNNCGTCGNSCGSGLCQNGVCTCATNETLCTGFPGGDYCALTSVDPNNCGQCGKKCAANQACVSGGCVSTCPAPLVKCGNKCVNLEDDNANCGMCGRPCLNGQGCSARACVTPVQPTGDPNPPKCVGGGPPIDVVDAGGQVDCTGNLGATAFTYAMCARSNIGPLSQQLFTDAFNSTSGPYVSSCTTTADCGKPRCRVSNLECTTVGSTATPCNGTANDVCEYRVKCVANTCVAGGVGINNEGPANQTALSNTALTHVGGDFWVYGTNGLAMKGATQVKERLINAGTIDVGKTSRVWDIAAVKGGWSSGGNASMTIDKTLYTEANCPPLGAGTLTLSGTPKCVGANGTLTGTTLAAPAIVNWFQALGATQPPAPCGRPQDVLPIQDYVAYAKANNDNALVGIPVNLFDTGSTTIRLDLPCGIFYFNQLNIGKDTTIVVHGRTAIFIAGAMRVSQKLILDLDPGATLDIFVGGVVNVSNQVFLGSPAYPRLSRLWIGGASCAGTGGCTNDSECCSGICNNGSCASGGGGNLSQSMSLSNGGFFNGLIYAGKGTFTHSGTLEMYGAIFTNFFDASGDTIIHYDKGATKTFEECQPTVPTGACESCRDCANQACVNNSCGQCTNDSQCCPPLRCDVGTGTCL